MILITTSIVCVDNLSYPEREVAPSAVGWHTLQLLQQCFCPLKNANFHCRCVSCVSNQRNVIWLPFYFLTRRDQWNRTANQAAEKETRIKKRTLQTAWVVDSLWRGLTEMTLKQRPSDVTAKSSKAARRWVIELSITVYFQVATKSILPNSKRKLTKRKWRVSK